MTNLNLTRNANMQTLRLIEEDLSMDPRISTHTLNIFCEVVDRINNEQSDRVPNEEDYIGTEEDHCRRHWR